MTKVPFRVGWARNTEHDSLFSDNFRRIMLFYVFESPCPLVSSSGRSLQERGWKKDVWKKGELRLALLNIADLVPGVNFRKAKHTVDITSCYDAVHLGAGFPKNCITESIAFYYRKGPDILDVWFHIRCALAHGRFAIYKRGGEVLYAFESIKKVKDEWTSRARMILNERTLVGWIDAVDGKEELLEQKKSIAEKSLSDEIISLIRESPMSNKKMIAAHFQNQKGLVERVVAHLSKTGVIRFDQSKHIWVCLSK